MGYMDNFTSYGCGKDGLYSLSTKVLIWTLCISCLNAIRMTFGHCAWLNSGGIVLTFSFSSRISIYIQDRCTVYTWAHAMLNIFICQLYYCTFYSHFYCLRLGYIVKHHAIHNFVSNIEHCDMTILL